MNAIVPGLTPKQIAERRKGIGGSDARVIMAGNWIELWQEKTGRREPEDLSGNLAVQMGNVTEAFNAYWYELKTGIAVDRRVKDKARVHPVHAFMRANLDGQVVIDGTKMVWDAKHTNAFGSQEDVVSTYFPQMQHNMEVSGLDHRDRLRGNSAGASGRSRD